MKTHIAFGATNNDSEWQQVKLKLKDFTVFVMCIGSCMPSCRLNMPLWSRPFVLYDVFGSYLVIKAANPEKTYLDPYLSQADTYSVLYIIMCSTQLKLMNSYDAGDCVQM